MNNSNLIFFNYNNKSYLYSKAKNNLFRTSEIAEKYFTQSILGDEGDDEVKILQKELDDLNRERFSNQLNTEEIYVKVTNEDINIIIEELKVIDFKKNIKYLFVFEFDNIGSQIENFFDLNIFFKDKNLNFRFLFKENLNFHFHSLVIKKILEHKFEFMFYSDINSLTLFNEKSNVRGKLFIELRLNTIEDLNRINELEIPTNYFLMLKSYDGIVSQEIMRNLTFKFEKYILDQSYNVSNFMNIVRLLKYDFQDNRNKSFYSKDIKDNNKCNMCWAKKICHTTKLYDIYSESPFNSNLNDGNCDSIKSLVKKYFQCLIMFKNKHIKNILPKVFENNGYKIKLINP